MLDVDFEAGATIVDVGLRLVMCSLTEGLFGTVGGVLDSINDDKIITSQL